MGITSNPHVAGRLTTAADEALLLGRHLAVEIAILTVFAAGLSLFEALVGVFQAVSGWPFSLRLADNCARPF